MKKSAKPLIERLISFEGQGPHPLERALEDDIEMVSIGMIKLPESRYYASYVMHTKGGVITKIVVDEPDIKRVAEDSAKISFVKEFMDKETE